jgi:hypothetical protein
MATFKIKLIDSYVGVVSRKGWLVTYFRDYAGALHDYELIFVFIPVAKLPALTNKLEKTDTI